MMMTLYEHSSGIIHEMFHTFMRGFAWHAGGRAASFFSPSFWISIVVIVAIIALVIWCYKALHH